MDNCSIHKGAEIEAIEEAFEKVSLDNIRGWFTCIPVGQSRQRSDRRGWRTDPRGYDLDPPR